MHTSAPRLPPARVIMAATEPVAAPAPAPTSAAAATLPAVCSLVDASLASFLAYNLR
ncbi:hypothetical protein ACJRO7_004177 [Eucalyptus globulus]|uniref:Uncharacterized protein n=1 Tax=Eucalyptus globulus TaxID=34317 RepID=A0ABD3IYY4_EUCGL